MDLPTLEERRIKGNVMTTFSFSNGYNKVDVEEFIEIGRT